MAEITTLSEIIDNCLEAKSILGATDSDNCLKFLIEWKDRQPTLIKNELAKELYPYLVIEFYEQRLVWKESGN